MSPKDSQSPKMKKKKKAFHGLRRGLSGSSPSNLLKALTGATSMNLLLAIPGYLHPGRGLKHWIFGSHWSEFSCLVFTGSMSGVFPQKKKTLQKTQRAKTFSAVGLFHSQETATRVSHGRSESLRQAWSWSSDMLVRNSSKTWLHGAFSDSRGVASSSVSDLGIHWLKPFFLLKLQCSHPKCSSLVRQKSDSSAKEATERMPSRQAQISVVVGVRWDSNVDPLVPPLAPRMSKQTRLTEAGMPQRLQDANDDQEIEGFLYQVIAVLKV